MNNHIQGASFSKVVTIPLSLPDGYFVGWVPTSQIRFFRFHAGVQEVGELIEDLSCVWADPLTTRTLLIQAVDTGLWPITRVCWDIRFTRESDDFKRSTNLTVFGIVKGATQ
jgi:hypothetical protein